MPKPNPGKTGDDKNKHRNNENVSSDSKKLNSAAPAYGHGVLNPGRIDPEFAGYGSRFADRGSQLVAYQVPHTARRMPYANETNINI